VIYREGYSGGNITIDWYIDQILELYIFPAAAEAVVEGKRFILKEDNDGGYGTRSIRNKVQKAKDAHNIERYANPPNSLDFSLIKNV